MLSLPAGLPANWALVDVETSGLSASRDRVLSLAVVTAGADGTPLSEYTTLLDPGVDPGPVHIHGLTRERLRGAPTFDRVAARVADLLAGRVMVAHNAQFDYSFLAGEFARAGVPMPVERRLCTLALNRRLAPPTPDLRLGTLAAHYGVPHARAHDALEDTRALAGILRASLAEARRRGVELPLVDCTPQRRDPHRALPKTPCAYRSPGPLPAGGPLVQGMKIAITGDTRLAREELVARGVAAGLNMMTSVSRHTSALVANDPGSGSGKARRARAEGVPIIDEETFRKLLEDVRPGVPLDRADTGRTVPRPRPAHPRTLPRGAVFDLPEAPWWTIAVSWEQQARGAADVVAFALDEDGRVAADGDFVFYGAPESTDGTVRLSTDGPAEQSVALDLAALPPAVRRVAVAAAIDGPGTFGDLGAIEVAAVPSTRSVPLARATLDTATTERTLLLAEVYRRGDGWRLRPVGQGHGHDLPELARSFGVDVED
ncbi:hypothetical protein GCM10009678_29750 [Actinomadura kijaniata]|uniref:DNA polymerase III epsilon subunit-like protein/stress response protein SCP2 n=1 Tax=Actinomadura namibiensis TaxID=182080 RepID=A0A7W3LK65_ACTNM|nr:TerD family protein [Actinomadura namibiensis]MBA8949577.1 DNA polymerase III epsilon subunit-like protein/stress response protein SCP2 [Actinomadura namibiensis]